MKNCFLFGGVELMKKTVALILVVFTITLSLSGCSNESYEIGDISLGFEFSQSLNAKVRCPKRYYEKNDVVFDIYICTYDYESRAIYSEDMYDAYNLLIYVSNSESMPFSVKDYTHMKNLDDVEGAVLVRRISYEEAFYTDFGYTTEGLRINYDHKEKIAIPKELITYGNDTIYIHLIELFCHESDGGDGLLVHMGSKTNIRLKYRLLGDIVRF